MKPEEIFKRYDIRGKYPEELDERFAERLGKAIGTFASENYSENVVVCRDNKSSSKDLKQAFIEGVESCGIKILDVGKGPTDYAAWAGMKNNCISVQVTSSHMPLEFNGFKFMYPEGNGFVNKDLYRLQELFKEGGFIEGSGSLENKLGLLEDYRNELIGFASKFSTDSHKKIVFDSMGGTGKIFPEIMREIGAEVVDISEEDRPYVDPPDPQPDNLGHLEQKVEDEEADLGIALDLDGDRITVYHKDRFLTGNEVFCVLSQLIEGEIVASIDTSNILEEFGDIKYTRVGDPFVLDKALNINSKLTGEPNGHYCFTEFVPYNSGLLTALIISRLDLDQKLEKIPERHVKRKNIRSERKDELIKFLQNDINEEKVISDIDGIKFKQEEGEVLVRASGSSPKIRIIAESENEESAEAILENTSERLNSL